MTDNKHQRQLTCAAKISGIYLITDDSPKEQLLSTVQAALSAGVRVVQYRDKKRCTADKLQLAIELRQLCHQYQALLIINDQVELAQQCQADGVHLGQSDGSVSAARSVLGDRALIGVSTRTQQMALQAQQQGADYIGVGSVYPTATKQDAVHIGIAGLQEIRRAVDIPIIAIGGIDSSGLAAVIQAGADGAAVVSAIMADPQPALAARELTLQFNQLLPLPCGKVLTIAGSDSSGGAGIQADIKTITLLGSYASSAITALTAQNTHGVSAINAPPADFVRQQISAVLSDIGADVIKTGMLYSAEIIATIADTLGSTAEYSALPCVIDPVMIAKGGSNLLQQQAIDTFIKRLLPTAYLLTPNVPEAEVLTGMTIADLSSMEQAAQQLHAMGARNVLVKGGHLDGDPVDVLLHHGKIYHYHALRINSAHTHGTGCSSAACIATLLAQGIELTQALEICKKFITQAIVDAPHLGHGHGPINHYTAALSVGDRRNDCHQ
ncbi:MAG: bifunctional hydroxymethylpyrimidine kinase/phosphomethylpyrimidine kinase [Desulfuromonas sp.]|nr:bifunctional hydroxymethylpyrimidine kinase/phosphomethylpyrimidine kinase [Desulfuromonas sp.]